MSSYIIGSVGRDGASNHKKDIGVPRFPVRFGSKGGDIATIGTGYM
jgi:hypothetical protein